MKNNIILAILCGLPGSGKTYLSTLIEDKVVNNRILATQRTIESFVVCYDDWLPAVKLDQFSENIVEFTGPSEWKQSRKSIRHTVEQLIAEIGGHPDLESDSQNTKLYEHFRKKLKNEDLLQGMSVIFIIDDNMHLRSMRFEYYQLARKYNIGFCQIYVKCDTSVALARNSSRSARVPDSVILAMAERFEAPKPENISWERLTMVTGGGDDDSFDSSWCSLERLVLDAFNNPVPSLENNDGEKSKSRRVCSASILHQADHALRKLLSEAMQNHAGKSSSENMKKLSFRLNAARQHILTGIKTGEICITSDILIEVKSGNVPNALTKLKTFLKEEMDRWL